MGSYVVEHYFTYVEENVISKFSHELRTPLHAITEASELLSEQRSDQNARQELLECIMHSGKDMINLLNDMLQFSNSIDLKIDLNPFHLLEMLNEVISAVKNIARSKKLLLKLVAPSSLPGRLIGDQRRIKQILLNFLSNAIKFTEKGKVELRVDWKQDPNGDYVNLIFYVEDTGPGISEKDQKKIFTKFLQLDASQPGTGLGLVICRDLARLMGGSVHVSSKLGKGSTFMFQVKLKLCKNESQINEQHEKKEKQNKFKSSFHVLLAEDNATIQKITARMIQTMGGKIDIVENGKLCVEAYLKNASKYDVILMDIFMPVMDGITATDLIRKMEKIYKWKAIPIIATTTSALTEDYQRGVKAGINGIVIKPFLKAELFNRLQEFIPHKT